MPFSESVLSLPLASCKQDITSGLNHVYKYSVVLQFRVSGYMLGVFDCFPGFYVTTNSGTPYT